MNPVISASGPRPGLVALGSSPIRISRHAIDRYRERVDRTAERRVAFQALAAMLASGSVRTTPRWWTTCGLEPGTRLVYSAVNADVCLIVKDGTFREPPPPSVPDALGHLCLERGDRRGEAAVAQPRAPADATPWRCPLDRPRARGPGRLIGGPTRTPSAAPRREAREGSDA
jgi:hypothetical protein